MPRGDLFSSFVLYILCNLSLCSLEYQSHQLCFQSLLLFHFSTSILPAPPLCLFFSSFIVLWFLDITSISEDIICICVRGMEVDWLKESDFEKRFSACLTLRGKDGSITPCAGVWMISQAHPSLYWLLDKRLAGFTSSSDEDFNIAG